MLGVIVQLVSRDVLSTLSVKTYFIPQGNFNSTSTFAIKLVFLKHFRLNNYLVQAFSASIVLVMYTVDLFPKYCFEVA